MSEQIILAVDGNGRFLEYIPKAVGHTGKGRRHLAIAVVLENSQGEVLLQKRKHQIFDNIWDITGATHPLHKTAGDESLEEATRRCLKEEWGISSTSPRLRGIKKIGVFNYFAQYGNMCENEHCYLLAGQYDGEVNLNQEMGYEYKWQSKKEFLKDIELNPQKYTPWAQETIKYIDRI